MLNKGADPFILDNQGRNCFYVLGFKGLTDCINIIFNFLRHSIRKDCLHKIKQAKKDFSFLKSDIHKGKLVSPDQTIESVRANFRKFLPFIEKVFTEDYLEQVKDFYYS